MEEAGADPKRQRTVNVTWAKGSRVSYRANWSAGHTTVNVSLPRKGPKLLHHNALVALAAAGIDTDTPMLAVSDSYFLANALAYELAREQFTEGGGNFDASLKVDELRPQKRSTCPPAWGDATKLIITKYADPEKDGTYVAFKEKKEKQIAAAQARIKKYEAEVRRAKKLLERAKRDKKKAQDSLTAAKSRRK
jgi:hypothetical protein